MDGHDTWFITWTTYGTWLPGDARGWRKRARWSQPPQPVLEQWCREQMKGETVLLSSRDRRTVERACEEHCSVRHWELLAVTARSNHVHVVVAVDEQPQKARDQLKANATRCLRNQEVPLVVDRTWTRGGDCEKLNTGEEIETVLQYVNEAQDRKGVVDQSN